MKAAKLDAIHRIANRLQSILGYLELEEHDKAIKSAKETVAELHRIKAIKSAKATIADLNRMTIAQNGSRVTVPPGSVIVVPHGSRVVSHEDVTVDVRADEVRAVGAESVRSGHGRHNPKTK